MNILEEIDQVDKKIIEIMQKNPTISYSDLAKIINKSQPAVGARILKLARSGIANTQFGMNFHNPNLPLFLIDLETNDYAQLERRIQNCPFIINDLQKTGQSNILLFATATSTQKFNEIVDPCLRRDKTIQHLNTMPIFRIDKDFIMPIDLKMEFYEKIFCSNDCPFKERKIIATSQGNVIPIYEGLEKNTDLKVYFDRLLDSMKALSKSDTIIIRFADKNNQLKSFMSKGLNPEVLKGENSINMSDCMCGFVCKGDKLGEALTEKGSFVLNNKSSLNKIPPELKTTMSLSCLNGIYNSIALIPIKTFEFVFGMIFLGSYEKENFSDDVIKKIESAANMIANAIYNILAKGPEIKANNSN
jgi:DNA-binding Lrp family transcriptional regulator